MLRHSSGRNSDSHESLSLTITRTGKTSCGIGTLPRKLPRLQGDNHSSASCSPIPNLKCPSYTMFAHHFACQGTLILSLNIHNEVAMSLSVGTGCWTCSTQSYSVSGEFTTFLTSSPIDTVLSPSSPLAHPLILFPRHSKPHHCPSSAPLDTAATIIRSHPNWLGFFCSRSHRPSLHQSLNLLGSPADLRSPVDQAADARTSHLASLPLSSTSTRLIIARLH
ncbi:hypothetical protein EDB92DRAFT_1988169 [Lactarius akahatsu]|uniref:Uncharacterized protein n=1 Tax=Lactarius akahatsu TaxID=416441 RepID=A0AAD4QE14_9AGAM|nr:hypothetical protein EDB92DRAFT_1988169 [Lactarius akahatsu]